MFIHNFDCLVDSFLFSALSVSYWWSSEYSSAKNEFFFSVCSILEDRLNIQTRLESPGTTGFSVLSMSAHPTVQIHAYVSPVMMTCPGCTPSQPTVEALWVYSVYKVAGLGISKKRKKWVELRSSSKLFVTLRVCARRPSGRLQRTVYSFSFITFHVSHMFTSTLFPYTQTAVLPYIV